MSPSTHRVASGHAEHYGGKEKHDQDQDNIAEPARPLLRAAQAHEVSDGLSEAMDGVGRFLPVRIARVHDAHAAWTWLPLDHPSRAVYYEVEFGISRALAYQPLDVTHAPARRRSYAEAFIVHRLGASRGPFPL
ncbi:hypothetical protein [Streptomyces alanosinicus]|nr:hypothetical protein [Streptomyces alanosinicus]